MVSKPIIIVAALFVATIVSAVVGYSFYHSYKAIVASLEVPPTLEDALSRVSSLRYTMTYYNGSTWIVLINVDNVHRRLNITYMTGNGTVLRYYLIGYSGNQIIYAEEVDPRNNNRTTLNIADIEGPLRTSMKVLVAPTGETGVTPFPGLGPLYALYTLTKSLSINWLNPSANRVQVRWAPASFEMGGKKYTAVTLEIVTRGTFIPNTPYSALSRVIAVAVNYKGVIVFPYIKYEAGETSLTLKLSSIKLTR